MAETKDNLNPETDGRMNKLMPVKWPQLIDLQIVGGLDFQAAMLAVGYSPDYAKGNGYKIKQDVRYCEMFRLRSAENKAETIDARTEHLSFLDSIRQDLEATYRDRIAAVKEYASICGWHSETIKTELTDRQAVLDSAQRQEMSRLALLALDTRTLPDVSTTRKAVQSTIQAQTVPTEPIQDMSPAPVQDMSPAPVQDMSLAPVQDMSPAPVRDMSPAPVQDKTIKRWPFTDRGSDND